MKKYYSLREISAELDIPKSTIVKYKDYFSDFLLMVGEGKRKKFDESALEVLSTIRRLREEEKLDWLEIKDEMSKSYGDTGPDISKGVATVPNSAAPQVEHLKHMVTAVAGELIVVSENVKRLDERSRRHSEALKVIARYAEYTKKNIEMVIADLMARENTGRRDVKVLAERVESEFRSFSDNLERLSAGMPSGASDNGGSEELRKVAEKLDSIMGKKTQDSEQFQMLRRENELLRKKLVDFERKRLDAAREPAAAALPPEREHRSESRRERPVEKKKTKGWLASLLGR